VKYFSEIIGKFSPAQRVSALLILCLTLSFLYLGPGIISKAKCQECTDKNREQSLQIEELHNKIRISQTECTDQIYAREKIFRERLDTLERMLISIQSSKPAMIIQEKTVMETIQDTVVLASPQVKTIRVTQKEPIGINLILEKVRCYQKDTLSWGVH
jgi:serine/threonine-protein kinase RIO1